MMRLRLQSRTRDERGAYAVLFALLTVVLMMMAGFAVDITDQVSNKHQLRDQLDAAAQAGAYDLNLSAGSTTKARASALSFAAANGGNSSPYVDFWCVVAATGPAGAKTPDTSQIPVTCNPGTPPYTVAHYPGLACSAVLCAIPCPDTGSGITCNTIRVSSVRDVPFTFGKAGGISKGSTGTVISVACRGACGTVAPNPMDVVVIGDRTLSMSTQERTDMVNGVKGMLQVMTPSQQYVAFGTIGRSSSSASNACKSDPSSSGSSGPWIPTPFSSDYLNAAGSGLNTNSRLYKGVNCLAASLASQGTSLAAPVKAAARYLLGIDANNLGSLGVRNGDVRKVLILETDGQPNEKEPTAGSPVLTAGGDIFSNTGSYSTSSPVVTGPVSTGPATTTSRRWVGFTNYTDTYKTTTNNTTTTVTKTQNGGQNACRNLEAVAANAKAQNILLITIAYNLDGASNCDDYNPALPASSSSFVDATPVITAITPTSCRSGQGTPASPFALETSCTSAATITRSVARTTTATAWNSAPVDVITNVLAAAASPTPSGAASSANNDCGTTAGQTVENADGDFFFCAATGTDMAAIFRTALSQVSTGIKLMNLP